MRASLLRVLSALVVVLLLLVCRLCGVDCLNSNYGSQLLKFSLGDGLIQPQSMVIDSAGNLFITDIFETPSFSYSRGRIVKYSSSGSLLTSDISQSVMSQFTIAASWTSVWTLAIDSSDNLYTNNGSRIVRLSPNAQSVLFTYPQVFQDVYSMTVDRSSGPTAGNLYVASYIAGTISVLSPTGVLLSTYAVPPGPFNSTADTLSQIVEMNVIGSTGSLFAADYWNGVVYIFSSAGAITSTYTLPSTQYLYAGTADASGNFYLAISGIDPLGYGVNGLIVKVAAPAYTAVTTVVTEDTYTYPTSLLLDSSGNFVVLDGFLYQVRLFTSAGAPKQQIRGGFAAYDFTVDATGNVFLCDDTTRDALALNADGSMRAYYPITGLDDGNSACSIVAVNHQGTVFAVLNGFGGYYVNGTTTGTMDGTIVYLFNVQTGAVINKVTLADNTDTYGLGDFAMDDASNIYYTLYTINNTQLMVRSGSTGQLINSFPLRSPVPNYYYSHIIDQNSNLHVFYYWPTTQGEVLQWDQLTLGGVLVKTLNTSFPTSSSSYSIGNSFRVDAAGWLYWMQRDYYQPTGPMTVYATNGTTTIAVYTDTNLLSAPSSIGLDASNNLYIDDVFNHVITKVIGVNSQTSPNLNGAAAGPRIAAQAVAGATMLAAIWLLL